MALVTGWAPLDSHQKPTDCSSSHMLPPGIVFRKVTKWRLLSFWNPQKKAQGSRMRSQLRSSSATYLYHSISIYSIYICTSYIYIYLQYTYSLGKLFVLIVHQPVSSLKEMDCLLPKPTLGIDVV